MPNFVKHDLGLGACEVVLGVQVLGCLQQAIKRGVIHLVGQVVMMWMCNDCCKFMAQAGSQEIMETVTGACRFFYLAILTLSHWKRLCPRRWMFMSM